MIDYQQGRVRLGFDADQNILVLREEIYDAMTPDDRKAMVARKVKKAARKAAAG